LSFRAYRRADDQPFGLVEESVVEEVYHRSGLVYNIHVGGQVISTTGEHPFYRHGTGWTRAIDLKSGDWLLTASDRWVMVEEVYDTGEVRAVYNLRVADLHTYFVGDDGWGWKVWAHNSNPEECPGISRGKERAKGGTYKLTNGERVMKTGRSKDLEQREKQLARHPKYGDLVLRHTAELG
jgi:intein/homing endonuclease